MPSALSFVHFSTFHKRKLMQTFFLDVEPIPFYSEKGSLTAGEGLLR